LVKYGVTIKFVNDYKTCIDLSVTLRSIIIVYLDRNKINF